MSSERALAVASHWEKRVGKILSPSELISLEQLVVVYTAQEVMSFVEEMSRTAKRYTFTNSVVKPLLAIKKIAIWPSRLRFRYNILDRHAGHRFPTADIHAMVYMMRTCTYDELMVAIHAARVYMRSELSWLRLLICHNRALALADWCGWNGVPCPQGVDDHLISYLGARMPKIKRLQKIFYSRICSYKRRNLDLKELITV